MYEPLRGNYEQRAYKEEFLEQYQNCSADVIQDIVDKAGMLSIPAFQELFPEREHQLTEDRQQAIACIFNGVKQGDPALRSLIEEFETLDKGSFGMVHTVKKDGAPLFLMKRSLREPGTNTDLVHESFVGLKFLNGKRSLTPAFVYTYGVVQCGQMAKEVRRVIRQNERNWCPHGRKQDNYLFLEHLQDSVTLQTYLQRAKPDVRNLFSILLQVESALNIANQGSKFTHYDLHDGNIMIQQLPREVLVPIYHGEEPCQIKTKLLVRIIDYGVSFFQNEEETGFGISNPDMVSFERNYPFRDTCALLNCIYDTLLQIQRHLSDHLEDEGDDAEEELEVLREYMVEYSNCLTLVARIYANSGRDLSFDHTTFFGKSYKDLSRKRGLVIAMSGLGRLEILPELENISHEDVLEWLTREAKDYMDVEGVYASADEVENYPSTVCIEDCQGWEDYRRELFSGVVLQENVSCLLQLFDNLPESRRKAIAEDLEKEIDVWIAKNPRDGFLEKILQLQERVKSFL